MSNGHTQPQSVRQIVVSSFIGALLSSGVVAFVGQLIAARRTESVVQQVRAEFARKQQVEDWKRQSLATLIGPVVMQLDRTKRAFRRYEANNRFLEAEILYRANLTIRDVLLANGHLIPEELRDVSGRLVEHYDRWLEEYDRVRGSRQIAASEAFVFAGPKGYPFPSDADTLFNAAYGRLRAELYGVAQPAIDAAGSAYRETP